MKKRKKIRKRTRKVIPDVKLAIHEANQDTKVQAVPWLCDSHGTRPLWAGPEYTYSLARKSHRELGLHAFVGEP